MIVSCRHRALRRLSLCLALSAWLLEPARAQYVEPRDYEPFSLRVISAGILARDFQPRATNTAPDSLAISYTRLMPVIGFRQGPVDILFGYTTFNQGGASRSSLFLGTVISQDLSLSGGRQGGLLLPLMIGADYTKAESGGPERESFNIASIGIGTGLKYRLATQAVDLSLSAGAIAHYAIEGLSIGTGFSGAVVMEAASVIRALRIGEGLALGYRFRLQTWSMSNKQLDYRAISHGPYLGIAF
ncbi:MAG TPA: hypothetical protein VF889_04440 [Bacteroidota bacterium]